MHFRQAHEKTELMVQKVIHHDVMKVVKSLKTQGFGDFHYLGTGSSGLQSLGTMALEYNRD